jgi:hypothetical protein
MHPIRETAMSLRAKATVWSAVAELTDRGRSVRMTIGEAGSS